MVKFENEFECGNSQDVSQHYAKFEIKIKLPTLRKAREIMERDGLGRIIHSKPPPVSA